jgi:maleylpyruvate isomerase
VCERSAEMMRRCIGEGLDACEALLKVGTGRFCFGETPTLADVALVPQLGNARRFDLDVEALWPRIAVIERHCMELAAFQSSVPSHQPDFE